MRHCFSKLFYFKCTLRLRITFWSIHTGINLKHEKGPFLIYPTDNPNWCQFMPLLFPIMSVLVSCKFSSTSKIHLSYLYGYLILPPINSSPRSIIYHFASFNSYFKRSLHLPNFYTTSPEILVPCRSLLTPLVLIQISPSLHYFTKFVTGIENLNLLTL